MTSAIIFPNSSFSLFISSIYTFYSSIVTSYVSILLCWLCIWDYSSDISDSRCYSYSFSCCSSSSHDDWDASYSGWLESASVGAWSLPSYFTTEFSCSSLAASYSVSLLTLISNATHSSLSASCCAISSSRLLFRTVFSSIVNSS